MSILLTNTIAPQQVSDSLGMAIKAAKEMPAEGVMESFSLDPGLTIALIGLLIFAAHLFTEIFSRWRIPDVLLLMIIGLVIGPILSWVSPSDLGSVAKVFTTITLVIILFESGTELNFKTILNSIRGTMKLTTINFFATMIIVSFIAIFLRDIDIVTGLMLGAILGGTSSAVVIPMVGQLKISQKSGTILILESAFSDVLCIVFAWAFMEAIDKGSVNVGQVIGSILSSFILASVIGMFCSIIWSYILDKMRHVKNSILTTPAFVFIVYGINEWFGFSGAIAALSFGIGMANIDSMYSNGFIIKKIFKKEPAKLNDTEKQLFSEVVFLLKTFFFIYIGISIKLDNVLTLVIGFIVSVILFLLRIPIVKLSMRREKDDIPIEDRLFMAGIVPKGLAAAVLATIPVQRGISGGEMIQNIVFAVILFSIFFTSILIPILEKDNFISRYYKKCFLPKKKEQSISDMIDNN